MSTFTLHLDPAAAAADIASLRADATALTPIPPPPAAPSGPVARLAAALSHAVAATNDQATLLSAEARRVAENMEVFCDGAAAIDAATARRLGVIQQ